MGNTFGGEWNRPGRGPHGASRDRGSRSDLQYLATYDNQPKNDCLSSLFLMSVLATTAVAAIRKGRTT